MISDLNLLHVFYVVANEESFSKASEKLYISQPAVSQNIKSLEDSVGFQLFTRAKKGVKLTQEGLEIYDYCKQIFKQVDLLNQTITDLSSLDTGTLYIGASDTICKYYLIDKLKEFETLFPKIRFKVTNCTTNESMKLLKNGDVDLVFVHSPIYEDVQTLNCLALHDVFVCAYDYDASNINHLSDLTNHQVLLLEEASSSRKMLDNNLLKYGVVLKPNFELASLDLLVEFSKKNMGITCIAEEYIQEELKNKELKIINIPEKLDTRYITLCYDKNLSTASKRFLEYIKKNG